MSRAEARDLAARFCAAFETAGAVPVDCDILQSAETLLDLYGEDIRSRAYVTQDPALGERMLFLDYGDGVADSKLTGAFMERRLESRGTARNMRSLKRILEKMDG